MIKAVIFDMGGVLVNLDKGRCIESFRRIGFPEFASLLDLWHQKGILSDFEEGKIGEEEFVSRCFDMCANKITAQQIKDSLNSLCTGIPKEKADFVKELAGKYPLYALSNNNPFCAAEFEREGEEVGLIFRESFKDLFYSFRMKLLKPSKEIYQEVVRRIGLPAEELLFIDDSAANVEAATSVGMKAVLYEPGTSLRDFVNSYL